MNVISLKAAPGFKILYVRILAPGSRRVLFSTLLTIAVIVITHIVFLFHTSLYFDEKVFSECIIFTNFIGKTAILTLY